MCVCFEGCGFGLVWFSEVSHSPLVPNSQVLGFWACVPTPVSETAFLSSSFLKASVLKGLRVSLCTWEILHHFLLAYGVL